MKRPLSQRSFFGSKIAAELPTSATGSARPAPRSTSGSCRRRCPSPAAPGSCGPRPAGSRVAELLDRGRAVALGELLAVGPCSSGRWASAAPRRRAPRTRAAARGVGEMVVAADHVGDLHLGVVDGDGEVVEDRAVARAMRVVELAWGNQPRRGSSGRRFALVRDPRRTAAPGRRSACRGSPVGAVLRLPGLDVLGGRSVAVGGAGVEQPRSPAGVQPARSTCETGPTSQSSSSQRSASRICSTSPGSSARGRCPRSAGPARRIVPGREPVVECRPRRPCARTRRREGPSETGVSLAC